MIVVLSFLKIHSINDIHISSVNSIYAHLGILHTLYMKTVDNISKIHWKNMLKF